MSPGSIQYSINRKGANLARQEVNTQVTPVLLSVGLLLPLHFPAIEYHSPLTSIKFYFSVTDEHVHE